MRVFKAGQENIWNEKKTENARIFSNDPDYNGSKGAMSFDPQAFYLQPFILNLKNNLP